MFYSFTFASGLSLRGLVVKRTPVEVSRWSLRPLRGFGVLEEQNVWLRLVHFVMFPTQALVIVSTNAGPSLDHRPYLCDANSSPLFLPQKLECALGTVMVVLGDRFQH